MPDPHDLRRRRRVLESERATLAARLRAEERHLTDAELTADARAARSAVSRIKMLRREEIAAATRLRAADTRITTLVTEVATEPPASAPADATVSVDLLGAVPADVPLLLLPV